MKSPTRLVFSSIILASATLLPGRFARAADTVPQAMVLQGKLVDSTNAPVEAANVSLTLQVRSPGSEDCLLFEETHSLDLSGSGGVFSVSLGSGHRTNPSTAFKDTSSLAQAFDNWSGSVGSLTCASGSSYAPLAKDKRKLKIIFDDGTATGPQTFADAMELNSVPFALHADSLRGKTPSDFAQVIDTNTQSRFIDAFSTRYTELNALLGGTSTQYTKADGTNFSPSSNLNFNSQRLTNIATPTAGTDAVNKNYCDANIGGKSTSGLATLGAPDAGKVLAWNGTNWIAQTASTTDATKLPLAGGTMSGAINMASNNITSAGHITQTSNHYLQLGAYDDTAEGTLVSGTLTGGGAAYKGVTWFNSTSNSLKYWNGTASVAVANGTFVGDVSGTSSATSVDKIKGKTVAPAAYSPGQVLRYDGTNWVNATLAATDLTGTLSVANGGTGATSLAAGNILVGGGAGAITTLASGSSGNILYGTGLASWASGSPDTAGLVDKSSTQTISGAKAFSNNVTLNAQNEVRFADSDSSNYVSLRAPATVTANRTFTLPDVYGTSGQVLTTDGAGGLSWTTVSGGAGSQWTTSGSDIYFTTNATGKVGIGTSSPGAKLQVANGNLRLDDDASLEFGAGSSGGWVGVYGAAGGHVSLQTNGAARVKVNYGGAIDFLNESSAPQMTILPSGYVGVGTTAPARLLQVEGPMRLTPAALPGSPAAGDLAIDSGDSNKLKYWNGSAWQTLVPSAGGLTSLNGLNGATQTFAVGTSGTAPLFNSTGTTHTLNIPMASTASVTAGLISKTDYDNFTAKLGTSSTFTGDVSGTSGTMSVDKLKGKSLVPVAYSAGQVLRYDGTNWVNAALAATDLTGTLAVANGGTGATSLGSGNILVGGGTGAVTSLASGGAGNIVYGTGLSSWASGSPDTAGLLDKTSIQTISGAKAFSTNITFNAQNEARFADSDSSNYVGLRAPATISSNHVYTLPGAIGSSGQALTTDASGNLSWASINSSQWTTSGSDIHYTAGKVGIGSSSPATTLDVAGAVKVGAGSTCDATTKGSIQFDAASGSLQTCNGSYWGASAPEAGLPNGMVVAMASCPSGWSDVGAPSSVSVKCDGVTCRLCQAPAQGTVIPGGSGILADTCPAGWTSYGTPGVSSGTYAPTTGGATLLLQYCAPPTDSFLPRGIRLMAASCSGEFKEVGQTPSTVKCPSSVCKVCELAGGPGYPRALVGGSGGSTQSGGNVVVTGGAGGTTSGAGGSVTVRGGNATDGYGGAIVIQAGSGATTTATARTGGNLTLSSGSGAGGGLGGTITIQTGNDGAGTYAAVVMQSGGGNVGIGVIPASKLDVLGEVRMASSGDSCSSTNEGAQRYNSTSKIMEFCNGTAWTSFTAAVPVIPSGAVMAFNLASCPSGWSALDGTGGRPDLRGRTVVGVGTGSGLTARALGDSGGDEKTDVSGVGVNVDVWGLTTQTINGLNLPADTTANTIGRSGGNTQYYPYDAGTRVRFHSSASITTSGTAGGGAGNMQPFVALLYCQKD